MFYSTPSLVRCVTRMGKCHEQCSNWEKFVGCSGTDLTRAPVNLCKDRVSIMDFSSKITSWTLCLNSWWLASRDPVIRTNSLLMGRLKAELCDQKCSVPQLLKELELEYTLVLPGLRCHGTQVNARPSIRWISGLVNGATSLVTSETTGENEHDLWWSSKQTFL